VKGSSAYYPTDQLCSHFLPKSRVPPSLQPPSHISTTLACHPYRTITFGHAVLLSPNYHIHIPMTRHEFHISATSPKYLHLLSAFSLHRRQLMAACRCHHSLRAGDHSKPHTPCSLQAVLSNVFTSFNAHLCQGDETMRGVGEDPQGFLTRESTIISAFAHFLHTSFFAWVNSPWGITVHR